MGHVLFVTGTDTGVGKTVFTGLLLATLRRRGMVAVAMKPFCTGDRADVSLLQSLQPGAIPDHEMNPFWFRAPLAPYLASLRERRRVHFNRAVDVARRAATRCEVLIVEGAGGALVPLTRSKTIADFAAALGGRVVIVGRNRLGVINHVRLTVESLVARGIQPCLVVLMQEQQPDASSAINAAYLRRSLRDLPVCEIPFLGGNLRKSGEISRAAKKVEKVLARFWGFATFTSVLWNGTARRADQTKGQRKKVVDTLSAKTQR